MTELITTERKRNDFSLTWSSEVFNNFFFYIRSWLNCYSVNLTPKGTQLSFGGFKMYCPWAAYLFCVWPVCDLWHTQTHIHRQQADTLTHAHTPTHTQNTKIWRFLSNVPTIAVATRVQKEITQHFVLFAYVMIRKSLFAREVRREVLLNSTPTITYEFGPKLV